MSADILAPGQRRAVEALALVWSGRYDIADDDVRVDIVDTKVTTPRPPEARP